ncbi:MAG: TIGR04438 family Trp-rich protein [Burkholderiales bacterium]
MVFLVVGLILIALKFLEIGPVAAWSWWLILVPFALAVAWWQYADATGLTKKREMDKEERKKKERLDKSRAALGMDTRKRR